MDETPEIQNPQDVELRRNTTMQNARAAIQSMQAAGDLEQARSSRKDYISELLLPVSLLLLILAIVLPDGPQIRSCAFLLPMAALFYYLYRRIGVVSTFTIRQAFVTWRLLFATFLMGASFSLFCLYTFTYVTKLLMNNI